MQNLHKLIDDCQAMDIGNQIATFGDAFLPGKAVSEAKALEAENAKLRKILTSAIKTADFENHPFRPWHYEAREALSGPKEGKE